MPSGYFRIFLDFSGWTSAHGIPHIGASNSKCLTAFWSIVFVASCCMFIYQMTELVAKYTKYEVTVQTELKFEERVFPSIAMCNLNPYLNSKMGLSQDLKELANTYQQFLVERTTHTTDPTNKWNLRDANDTITAHSTTQKHLLFVSRNLDNTTKQSMSYKLRGRAPYDNDFTSRFVLDCVFNEVTCNMALRSDPTGISPVDPKGDFDEMFDPQFGTCFVFNNALKYVGTKAGPTHGLSILTMSNQQEYLPLTESAGVRVAIHTGAEDAFPDAFGYNAAAGFTTSFGIKVVNTKRLPYPHGDCRDAKPTAYYYNGPYTVEGCVRSCTQEAIIKKCGCGDPRYKLPHSGGVEYCKTLDTTQRQCLEDFVATSSHGVLTSCDCPQPCDQSSYSVTVSTSLWPGATHVIRCNFQPAACKKDGPWGPATDANAEALCRAWFKENTMLVEVYYERMNYQQLQESPAYTLVNLISDTGGQLGLWLGISVITVVEFLALLLMCCTYCIAKPDLDKLGGKK